jgi:uncharacterized protein (TIGR02611 family)
MKKPTLSFALDRRARILLQNRPMSDNEKGTVRQRADSLYRSLPRPLRRVSVLVLGSVILIAGIAMLVLPGPGLLVMGVAIAVLALEFDWAKRLAERATRTAKDFANRFRRWWGSRRPSSEAPQNAADVGPDPPHQR